MAGLGQEYSCAVAGSSSVVGCSGGWGSRFRNSGGQGCSAAGWVVGGTTGGVADGISSEFVD